MSKVEETLRSAPKDGKCPECGSEEFQLVEEVLQWHRGRFVKSEGYVFHGNASWDNVSESGNTLHMECRSCFTKFEVPDYDWGL